MSRPQTSDTRDANAWASGDTSIDADSADAERRFGSVDRAYGHMVTAELAKRHVVVVGLGGVGSWASEALARSAIGQLTLIDLDHVAPSNINRQVHALDQTIGQAKVLAMRDRIQSINSACQVHAVEAFVEPGNPDVLIPHSADVVLDCTDQISAKLAMVLCAKARGQRLIVCGAAGGKTDALTLKFGDLRDSSHDSLLARLRTKLRKEHGFAAPDPNGRNKKRARVPRMGVQALWFEQPAHRPLSVSERTAQAVPLSCAGYGSLVTVTAAMGLAAAGQALNGLAGLAAKPR